MMVVAVSELHECGTQFFEIAEAADPKQLLLEVPAAAARASEPRRNWTAPDSIPTPPVPHRKAAEWKAKPCGSWFRLPKGQRAAILQRGNLLAQQLVVDAYAGDYRFESPLLLVRDFHLAALQNGFTTGQKAISPFDQRGGVTRCFREVLSRSAPRRSSSKTDTLRLADHRSSADDRGRFRGILSRPTASFRRPGIVFLRVGHAFSPSEHSLHQMFPMHCPPKFRAGGPKPVSERLAFSLFLVAC